MRKNYGYDSYRGRSPLRSVLKWIIALLAAVLVLTVAALLWLQQFMVYSSEGGRLVFPWTEQNTPSASPSAEWESPAVSPTVVVVFPSPAGVGVMAVTRISLPSGRSRSRSSRRSCRSRCSHRPRRRSCSRSHCRPSCRRSSSKG